MSLSVLLSAPLLTSCCGFTYAFVVLLNPSLSLDITSMEHFGRLISLNPELHYTHN